MPSALTTRQSTFAVARTCVRDDWPYAQGPAPWGRSSCSIRLCYGSIVVEKVAKLSPETVIVIGPNTSVIGGVHFGWNTAVSVSWGLREAVDGYALAQDELVEARNRLARAIAGAAMSGLTQAEIVELTGYPADRVLRICTDAGLTRD
jgi:hypothetical protein